MDSLIAASARVDSATGAIRRTIESSGLESDGRDLFYCGGGTSGTVRAVRRPRTKGT